MNNLHSGRYLNEVNPRLVAVPADAAYRLFCGAPNAADRNCAAGCPKPLSSSDEEYCGRDKSGANSRVAPRSRRRFAHPSGCGMPPASRLYPAVNFPARSSPSSPESRSQPARRVSLKSDFGGVPISKHFLHSYIIGQHPLFAI